MRGTSEQTLLADEVDLPLVYDEGICNLVEQLTVAHPQVRGEFCLIAEGIPLDVADVRWHIHGHAARHVDPLFPKEIDILRAKDLVQRLDF